MLSPQFASPRERMASVALPSKVSITATFCTIWLGSLLDVAIFDQVGHQRMQPVHRDELFREVERRAEMVDAAIDVVRDS